MGWNSPELTRRKKVFMDAASPKRNRRVVRDFSRRNFVIFYLVLLLVPSAYLIWYYTSTIWGGVPVQDTLHVGAPGATIDSQATFFWHLIMAAWKAAFRMLPYSIGQYLLGLECAFDQQFLWASGSLVASIILSLVLWVDVSVNPELSRSQKGFWTALFCLGGFLGLLLPQFCYWYFYMWLEPESRTLDPPIISDAVSA
jgi:hypothetical protein